MSPHSIGILVLNELRVRTRRLSTVVCLLAVIAISYWMVGDQSQGRSMIVVGKQAASYNSTTLAIGSSALASLMFGLSGFYLARGRTRDDLRFGVGAVLAVTPISNAQLILARWLGAMAYLCAMVLALMLTIMLLQLVRGAGVIEPLVYLQSYALLLLPTLALAASIAVLCDAYAPLMGKRGDVLYFIFWAGQFGAMPAMLTEREGFSVASIFDSSGIATTIVRFRQLFQTDHFNIGGGNFDLNLPMLTIDHFWTIEMTIMRLLAIAIAMLPLLIAIKIFHRYSPDKVKAVSGANKPNRLWGWANRLAKPASILVRPLLRLAATTPGIAGQVLADTAVTIRTNPALITAMSVIFVVGMLVPDAGLSGVAIAGVACWGILVSDFGSRDHQSATHLLTAVVTGGVIRRFIRQVAFALLLGMVTTLPVLVRWTAHSPTQAAALVTGLLLLSSTSVLLGRLTRSGRTFLGVFLFGLYIAGQVKEVRWFDVAGFNGSADAVTIATYGLVGLLIAAIGFMVTAKTAE